MTEDAKNDVRNSIENLVQLSREALQLNAEHERLAQRQSVLQTELDIARQQNFLSCVDLLKSEQGEVLKNKEFFHYILSSLMSWKHYESRQQRDTEIDPQRILRDMFSPHLHETHDTAEQIFENANLDLMEGMNVEKALNEELQKLGFTLTLLNSIQSQEDGSYHIDIFLMACVDDVDIFMREAPSYDNMFETLASTAYFGDHQIPENNASSDFSFTLILREYYDSRAQSLEDMPVMRAEPVESPFDDMDERHPIRWSVYEDIHHMAGREVSSTHTEMLTAMEELQFLSGYR